MAVVPTSFGFKPDRKITDVIREGGFTLSAEVIPPRNGTEQRQVLSQIAQLIEAGAQFLSVTKGAGGSLRGGSLPIAQAVKEQFGVPCIAHFTCRDLTPQDVENQLMDHHYFGIRNILGLRGDPPTDQPHWTPMPGSYVFAHELIARIRDMNDGRYLSRVSDPSHGASRAGAHSHERTDFCIGAAAYPEHPDVEERARFFELKVKAGASYGITQMVFDADAYGDFLDLCDRKGVRVPVLPGTRFLRTRAQADRMAQRFQVGMPARFRELLPEKDTPETFERALEANLLLVNQLKRRGATGVHVFVLSDTAGACRLLSELRAGVAK